MKQTPGPAMLGSYFTRKHGSFPTQRDCPCSEQRSNRWPSTVDECECCGKLVRTRRDGTYARHTMRVR